MGRPGSARRQRCGRKTRPCALSLQEEAAARFPLDLLLWIQKKTNPPEKLRLRVLSPPAPLPRLLKMTDSPEILRRGVCFPPALLLLFRKIINLSPTLFHEHLYSPVLSVPFPKSALPLREPPENCRKESRITVGAVLDTFHSIFGSGGGKI